MEIPRGTDLQQQLDELAALVKRGQDEIEALASRADETAARIVVNRADIDDLQTHVSTDRELIAELQADGVVGREHTAQLERALATSRTIGAAVGILMATRHVEQDEALQLLKAASSRANTPMRQLADVIVSRQKASADQGASRSTAQPSPSRR